MGYHFFQHFKQTIFWRITIFVSDGSYDKIPERVAVENDTVLVLFDN